MQRVYKTTYLHFYLLKNHSIWCDFIPVRNPKAVDWKQKKIIDFYASNRANGLKYFVVMICPWTQFGLSSFEYSFWIKAKSFKIDFCNSQKLHPFFPQSCNNDNKPERQWGSHLLMSSATLQQLKQWSFKYATWISSVVWGGGCFRLPSVKVIFSWVHSTAAAEQLSLLLLLLNNTHLQ